MPLQHIKLLTIDLDGTMIDSVLDLHAAVNGMQQALNESKRSLEEVRSWVGNGIERLVHRAITGTMHEDASTEILKKALPEFMQAYHDANGHHAQAYPGVIETLQQLHQRPIRLICVTNKTREFTWPLLQALQMDQYFELIIAGDDVQNKKPAPDALLHALDHYGINRDDAAMVGDSVSDISAAHSAGFTSVCVSYGYNHGVPVRQLQGNLEPDFIIDEFAELGKLLGI